MITDGSRRFKTAPGDFGRFRKEGPGETNEVSETQINEISARIYLLELVPFLFEIVRNQICMFAFFPSLVGTLYYYTMEAYHSTQRGCVIHTQPIQ